MVSRGRTISGRAAFLILLGFIAAGVVFRFINLDKKVYWYDEVSTSITLSGYTEKEIVEAITKHNQPISAAELLDFQKPRENSSLLSSLNRLLEENPHHPPLYYLIAKFWTDMFGSSVWTIRFLSALFSLLAVFAVAWLAWELFASWPKVILAATFFSLSPLHLVYAQEARQYSLLTVLILLSGAALLRAFRKNTIPAWITYSVLIILGLYTHLFFAFVIGGHIIFILRKEILQHENYLRRFLLSLFCASFCFLPWLFVLISNYNNAKRLMSWSLTGNVSSFNLFSIFMHNISRTFVDYGFEIGFVQEDISFLLIFSYYCALIMLVSVIYFLITSASKETRYFILPMLFIPPLFLLLPDIFFTGQRSFTPRYQLPLYIGFELALAAMICFYLQKNHAKKIQRYFFSGLLTALLFLKISSCFIFLQKDRWWNKFMSNENIAVANYINELERPLIVSFVKTPYLLSLSYSLDQDVYFLINPLCSNCSIEHKISKFEMPSDFSDILYLDIIHEHFARIITKKIFDIYLERAVLGKVLGLWRIRDGYNQFSFPQGVVD